MLVDIHSHLLPGVDDGAKDIEKSIELAKIAVGEGVGHLVLTPHHYNHQYINHQKEVVAATRQLQQAYDQAGIKLKLYPSQEIRIRESLVEDILYSNDFMSLDQKGRYYLIEMPTKTVPDYALSALKELIDEGITPVIAHPERNHAFAQKKNLLYQFIEAGCLGQVTSHSYIGLYGEKLRQISLDLMKHQLIHVIASDAHHIKHRPFNLAKAYQQLEQDFDKEKVNEYQKNALSIINGEVIRPNKPKKKKLFGIF